MLAPGLAKPEGGLAASGALVLLQLLATTVWFAPMLVLCSFALLPAVSVTFVVNFALLAAGLGLYRFIYTGKLRARVFGVIPFVSRAVLLASPTHLVHGVALGLLGGMYHPSSGTQVLLHLRQIEGDGDGLSSRGGELLQSLMPHISSTVFFQYFLLGWMYSTTSCLQSRLELSFSQNPDLHYHRISTSLRWFMRYSPVSLILNLVLSLWFTSSTEERSLWFVCGLGLELFDMLWCTILRERRNKQQASDLIDAKTLETAVMASEPDSVLEAFHCLPLVMNKSNTPSLSGRSELLYRVIARREEATQPELISDIDRREHIAAYWSYLREQIEIRSRTTSMIDDHDSAAPALVQLSQERFQQIMQIVYSNEAMDPGVVFAKRKSLPVLVDVFRMRGLMECEQQLSFPATSIATPQQDSVLNTCLDFIDVESVMLLCFSKVASRHLEPPRNPETGLATTDAFVKTSQSSRDDHEHVRIARDSWFDSTHVPYVSTEWWVRTLAGECWYEYDPIYEESLRRWKQRMGSDMQSSNQHMDAFKRKWWCRSVEQSLFADFHLIILASKILVTMAKKRKVIVSLVKETLQRCCAACEEAERVYLACPLQQEPQNLFYAMQFCLERDMQQLS